MVAGMVQGAVGDLLDGAAQDFAGAGLWPADGDRELEGGDRAELIAHQRHDLLLDIGEALRNPPSAPGSRRAPGPSSRR